MIMKRFFTLTATILFLSTSAPGLSLAQNPGPHGKGRMMMHEQNQPGTIKGLTAREEEAYRTGMGIGMARVAELNHYPGPRHVLDLAEELNLTDDQKETMTRLMSSMKAQATALGAQILEKEQALDEMFAAGTMDEEAVHALLREIGALKADLRFAHIRTHMATRAALTPEQVETYDRLRGYSGSNQN